MNVVFAAPRRFVRCSDMSELDESGSAQEGGVRRTIVSAVAEKPPTRVL